MGATTHDLTNQRTWLKLGRRGGRVAAETGREAARRGRAAAERARRQARDLDPADLASIAKPIAEGVADAVATMPERIRSIGEDIAQLRPEQLRASATRIRCDFEPRSRSRRPIVIAMVAAAAAGAALGFLFDPDRGRSRRAEAADRLAAVTRRGAGAARRWSRDARARLGGVRAERAREHAAAETVDDVTLAHKVESELFRDPSVPKGPININAENGVVILRGRVETNDAIEQVMAATLAIDGVRIVRSLLRTPDQGTQAPDSRELVRSRSGA